MKLQRNFIDFICNHVSDSFFEEEAADISIALTRSELKRALRNAYMLRSGYVHELKTILKQLKIPQLATGDVFHWGKEPYLTFAGLLRIVKHVIKNFIFSREVVNTEDYNWRADLPGVISLEIAPQYWVWQYEDFEPTQATKKFSGFLSQLQAAFISNEPLSDLRGLLEKFEELFLSAKEKDKITMFCIYFLYSTLISEEFRPKNHTHFIRKNIDLSNQCCLETTISYLILGQEPAWSVQSIIKVYNEYESQRFAKYYISLPQTIEVAFLCLIANLHLKENKIDDYIYWQKLAVQNASGRSPIQDYIKKCSSENTELDFRYILTGCKQNQE